MLLILIVILVLMALLYPRDDLNGVSFNEANGRYADNYIVAINNPTTIYRINPKIKEQYQNPELYQYFVDKSIEAKIDEIYNLLFADCLIITESGWNPEAKNPLSTAHGLGQFLDRTWDNVNRALGDNLDRNDPYNQIDAFVYLLSTEGYGHWTVASSCIYLLPVEKRIPSLK